MTTHAERTRSTSAAARWTWLAGRAFLILAGFAFAAFVVGLVLSGTAYGAQKGCEECTPHITVVLYAIFLLILSILLGLVGVVLQAVSIRLGRAPERRRMKKRPS
jgi:hypothetical protein